VAELVAWLESPSYEAVIVAVPREPVYEISQEPAAERVHVGVPENATVLLAEKSTLPLGVVAVPVSVSETTASQVPVWPTRITDGQLTEVEVERNVAREDFPEAVPSHNTAAAPTMTATTARTALRILPCLLIDLRHLRPFGRRAQT
jgi:hypothetical protein